MRLITTLFLLTLGITPTLSWSLFSRDYDHEHELALEAHELKTAKAYVQWLGEECQKYAYPGEDWQNSFLLGEYENNEHQTIDRRTYLDCKANWNVIWTPPPKYEGPVKKGVKKQAAKLKRGVADYRESAKVDMKLRKVKKDIARGKVPRFELPKIEAPIKRGGRKSEL